MMKSNLMFDRSIRSFEQIYHNYYTLDFTFNNTIYTPDKHKDFTDVSMDEVPAGTAGILLSLGFIEYKRFNNLFFLTERGFQYLQWIKENHFKFLVDFIVNILISRAAAAATLRSGDFERSDILNNEKYFRLLFKKEDIATVLSIITNKENNKVMLDLLNSL